MYASEDMSPNNCLAWKALYYTAQDVATDLLYNRRESFHLPTMPSSYWTLNSSLSCDPRGQDTITARGPRFNFQ